MAPSQPFSQKTRSARWYSTVDRSSERLGHYRLGAEKAVRLGNRLWTDDADGHRLWVGKAFDGDTTRWKIVSKNSKHGRSSSRLSRVRRATEWDGRRSKRFVTVACPTVLNTVCLPRPGMGLSSQSGRRKSFTFGVRE